jgi:uncharacterized repeat protein (TIGR01451 family)
VTTITPQTLTIQATVVSPNTQTNTATIAHSDQFDPTTANNTASATVTPQQADLALAKTVSNATPNVGDTITFTVTLRNNGPDPATNVTVKDVLPAGVTFVSATPSQGTYNSGTGVWAVGTVTAIMPPTLTIQATVLSPNRQTNTATITHSDQFDPNTANNTASATVNPQADLALTKTVSNATPNVGDTITFTVTLRNNGPDPATNVTVKDVLPAGLTFVSATPSQGTYNQATGLWTVGTVNVGTPQSLQIRATVVSPGAQTNTATITHSDQFDPNLANNSASASYSAVATPPPAMIPPVIPPAVTPVPPPVPPVLSGLTAVHRCVTSAVLEHAHAGSGGLAFSFTLSEAAKVTFAVLHRVGSPAWTKCPPVRGRTQGTYRSVGEPGGALVPAGPQTISLGSAARARHLASVVRLAPGRHGIGLAQIAQTRLPPGTYVVSAKAVNSAGQASSVEYAKFWVIS